MTREEGEKLLSQLIAEGYKCPSVPEVIDSAPAVVEAEPSVEVHACW